MSEWTDFVASKDVRRRTMREMWEELGWGYTPGDKLPDKCYQYSKLSEEEFELFERELIRRVTSENALWENAREAVRFTVHGNPKVVRVNAGQMVEWVNELGEVVMDTPKQGFVYTGEIFRGKRAYVRASEFNPEADTKSVFVQLGGYTHNGSQVFIREEDVD